MSGTLFVVSTPIGNLEDITLRALRVLREVSLVAAEDTRRTAILLKHYNINTPSTSVHEHNERTRIPRLIERLKAGDSIALVSDAGTPTVSDPGFPLIRAARETGIRVEVIPGPSAVLIALVASGLPSESFTFLGYAPFRSKARIEWLTTLLRGSHTTVFFDSPRRIRETLAELSKLEPTRSVAVTRELTKMHETLVIGPISEVHKTFRAETKGEITVVVGPPEGARTSRTLVDATLLRSQYGCLTNNGDLSRREAIRSLARRYGLSNREVYSQLEESKK
jgi:16S rRNA (cytidine1402-2'-O)-methyltransferase